MNKFLIATHFQMASGIMSSVRGLVGDIVEVETIDAYYENVDLYEKSNEFLNRLQPDDVAIIFTDIKFGSVNQYFINRINGMENVHLISGVNLPVILELLLITERIDRSKIQEAIDNARKELCYVELNVGSNDEDELFD